MLFYITTKITIPIGVGDMTEILYHNMSNFISR